MVSAQIKGTQIDLGFYGTDGSWTSCYTGIVDVMGAGGSSEGAIATAITDNASWKLSLQMKPAKAGSRLMVRYKLGAASAVDKSDGIMLLPITVKDLNSGRKTVKILTNTSFGTATDVVSGDFGIWQDYANGNGTDNKVEAGQEVCWGSSPASPSFLSIENGA